VGQRSRSIIVSGLFPASGCRTAQSEFSPAPTLCFEYLKYLEADPETEQVFSHDLFRLLADEDVFDWTVNDLGRCLALAVFREHVKQRAIGS
jgi:hypothetical protein